MRVMLCALTFLFSFPVVAAELSFSVHDFAPYVIIKDDKPTGAFVEIVEKTCKKIDYKCTVNFYPNRRSKSMLKKGQVNGNFPLGKNAERDKWIHWTSPLMRAEYGFFVKKGGTFKPTKPEDFAGKSVGVFGPSNTATSLKKLNEKLVKDGLKAIDIQEIANSTGQNMQKLMKGRIDAVYVNRAVGRFQIKKKGYKDLEYAVIAKKLTYYAGFAKDHNEMRLIKPFIDEVANMAKSGDLAKVVKSHDLEPIE